MHCCRNENQYDINVNDQGLLRIYTSTIKRRNALVLRRLQRHLLLGPAHHFRCDGVVHTVEAIPEILLRELAGLGHHVLEGTFATAIALTWEW